MTYRFLNPINVRICCKYCSTPSIFPVEQSSLKAYKNGMIAQKAFPYLSADKRELFISQTCGSCFDKLFPPEQSE